MTGARTFWRAFVRRDRWHYLWWTLGVALLYYSQAVSVKGLYTTQAEFDRAAASMQTNTAFIDDPSVDTVLTEGPEFVVNARVEDEGGVDTVYVDLEA